MYDPSNRGRRPASNSKTWLCSRHCRHRRRRVTQSEETSEVPADTTTTVAAEEGDDATLGPCKRKMFSDRYHENHHKVQKYNHNPDTFVDGVLYGTKDGVLYGAPELRCLLATSASDRGL